MKKIDHFGGRVAQLFFSPMLLAYVWVSLGYIAAAAVLYIAALALTRKFGLFAHVKKWPKVSQAALYSSPLLIGAGLYFSTRPPTWWIMAPLIVHAVLCMVAGIALNSPWDAAKESE